MLSHRPRIDGSRVVTFNCFASKIQGLGSSTSHSALAGGSVPSIMYCFSYLVTHSVFWKWAQCCNILVSARRTYDCKDNVSTYAAVIKGDQARAGEQTLHFLRGCKRSDGIGDGADKENGCTCTGHSGNTYRALAWSA